MELLNIEDLQILDLKTNYKLHAGPGGTIHKGSITFNAAARHIMELEKGKWWKLAVWASGFKSVLYLIECDPFEKGARKNTDAMSPTLSIRTPKAFIEENISGYQKVKIDRVLVEGAKSAFRLKLIDDGYSLRGMHSVKYQRGVTDEDLVQKGIEPISLIDLDFKDISTAFRYLAGPGATLDNGTIKFNKTAIVLIGLNTKKWWQIALQKRSDLSNIFMINVSEDCEKARQNSTSPYAPLTVRSALMGVLPKEKIEYKITKTEVKGAKSVFLLSSVDSISELYGEHSTEFQREFMLNELE